MVWTKNASNIVNNLWVTGCASVSVYSFIKSRNMYLERMSESYKTTIENMNLKNQLNHKDNIISEYENVNEKLKEIIEKKLKE